MKKVITAILTTSFVSLSAQAQENILQKLKQPLIKEDKNSYIIEHYDKISLKEKTFVMFKEFNQVVVKTECKMKKGLISKGNFTAICVAVGSGFSQGLFQPVFDKIKTVEWVLDREKIKKADFVISLEFQEKGVNLNLSHERGSQNLFIPYEDIIVTKVVP